MKANSRSFLLRYTVAVAATAVAVILRTLLLPIVGNDIPFTTLFPAIAISALFGGLGPGLLSTLLGALAVNFLIMPPNFTFTLSESRDFAQVAVALIMGGFISWMVSERGRVQARLVQVETESERQSRESEKALRESEERSRLAQKSTGVGIWEWELKTNAVDWSEGVFELLGLDYQKKTTYFKDWLEFIVPEDRERAVDLIQRLIADGHQEFYDEFRIKRRSDGAVRWVATQGQIIRGSGNQAIRLRGVNYDITSRKEAELKIKKLNDELDRHIKELQTIFDIAPVGIAFAQDASCSVIIANPALARMVGVAPGENVSASGDAGKLPYKHLQNGRELAADELPMQRAVAEKRTILNEEIDILRADGSMVTIYGYAAPIFDADGNVISCVSAQIDVTERKKAELERERKLHLEQVLRQQAEEASRLKDEFLATISHELRTPLNSILGWVTMLRHEMLESSMQDQALEAIERGAKSQAQLIEDLLDVSRIISGKLQLNVKPVELASVISAAVETVRPAAEAKGIRTRIRFESPAAVISGDYDRLQQIVWNLLSNAIKFTPKGGSVEIILQQRDAHAEIIVTDTGRGISPDFMPFVFDRFRQADGSITRTFTGLGLGLSIVRHLVELHGGIVRVHSDGEGKGATFTVELPVMALPVMKEEAPAYRPAGEMDHRPLDLPVLGGIRILVVDDEENTRKILRLAFEDCRADVETAESVAEALEKFKQRPPHLVISDIGMPGEDGFSFMRKVRAWERQMSLAPVPAIALTAYARHEDRERAISSGYQAHVPKPIEPDKLALIGAGLIDKSRSLESEKLKR